MLNKVDKFESKTRLNQFDHVELVGFRIGYVRYVSHDTNDTSSHSDIGQCTWEREEMARIATPPLSNYSRTLPFHHRLQSLMYSCSSATA